MCHALIIDDNMVICRAVRERLARLGFDTIEQTWCEQQAVVAALRHRPDLIVIGDCLENGSAINAARQIAAGSDIPVLMLSGDPGRARQCLQQAVAFDGPFLLNEIETAIELARGKA